MTMTRKHFIAIAEALKESRPAGQWHNTLSAGQWIDDVHNVADAIAEVAPNFDRDQFLATARAK